MSIRQISSAMLDDAKDILQRGEEEETQWCCAPQVMQPYFNGEGKLDAVWLSAGAVPSGGTEGFCYCTRRGYAVVTVGGHMQVKDGGTVSTPRADIEISQAQWAGVDPEEGDSWREFERTARDFWRGETISRPERQAAEAAFWRACMQALTM